MNILKTIVKRFCGAVISVLLMALFFSADCSVGDYWFGDKLLHIHIGAVMTPICIALGGAMALVFSMALLYLTVFALFDIICILFLGESLLWDAFIHRKWPELELDI